MKKKEGKEKITVASVFDSKFDSSAIDKLDYESINFTENHSLLDKVKI